MASNLLCRILLFFALFSPLPRLVYAQSPPGKKIAVLAGIQNYSDPSLNRRAVTPTLSMVADWLSKEMRFDIGTPLFDASATKENILQTIRTRTAGLGIGDSFTFYLMTHGFVDQDGTAGFLTYSGSSEATMSSKELAGALRPALQKGVAITLVLETCHSGNAIKGEPPTEGSYPAVTIQNTILAGKTRDISSQIRSELKEAKTGDTKTDVNEDLPYTTRTRSADDLLGTLTILSACTGKEWSWMSQYGHFTKTLVETVKSETGATWSKIMTSVRKDIKQYDPLIAKVQKPNKPSDTQTPIIRGADTKPFEPLKRVPQISFGQLQKAYSTYQSEDPEAFRLWVEIDGKELDEESKVLVSKNATDPEGDVFELKAAISVPGWLFVVDRTNDGKPIITGPQFSEKTPNTTDGWLEATKVTQGAMVSFGKKAVDEVGTQEAIGLFFRDEAAAKEFAQQVSSGLLLEQKIFSVQGKVLAKERSFYTSRAKFKVVAERVTSVSILPCSRTGAGFGFGIVQVRIANLNLVVIK